MGKRYHILESCDSASGWERTTIWSPEVQKRIPTPAFDTEFEGIRYMQWMSANHLERRVMRVRRASKSFVPEDNP